MGEYVTLDRAFDGLPLVSGRIRDIGQGVWVFLWYVGEYVTLDRTF